MSKTDSCPACHLKGWKRKKFENKPILTYGAEKIPSPKGGIIFRYKRCLNCNHRWITKEDYWKDVNEDNAS